MKTETSNTHSLKATYGVKNMSCASCAMSVESMLKAQAGVTNAQVNYAGASVLVEYQPELISPEKMKKAIQGIGYDLDITAERDIAKETAAKEQELMGLRFRAISALVLSFPVFLIGMFFHHRIPGGNWIMMALTAIILFVMGRQFFVSAWKQARHLRVNMDTLVALSTGIAFLFSFFNTVYPQFLEERGIPAEVYYESAAVIVAFILLGKYLEERAKSRSASAIRKLMGLQPKFVKVIRNGKETEMPIQDVLIGDQVSVRPGDRIPVDGIVKEGHSFVNESMLTGEPIPAEKKENDKTYSGTLNQQGHLIIIAQQIGQATVLAQIIRQVQEAQGSKAPVQQLADKIASWFVPAVILIAITTFAAWQIFGGPDSFIHAMTATIAVLIIACPCALGLATPTALMAGIGKGAENGILVKNAESLERAREVNALVLDKTGTITEGYPSVSDIHWLNNSEKGRPEPILLAMEKRSDHPLAIAISNELEEKKVQAANLSAFANVPGKGIRAEANGIKYLAGSRKFMEEEKVNLSQHISAQDAAASLVYFAEGDELLAVVVIKDSIRPAAAKSISLLQSMNIEVHMLTGDRKETTEAVATETGIDHFKAEMLPADKAAYIQQLQQQGKTVAMAGDGINDAQALAVADVSMAMSKGNDIAMDVAQLTLMHSDLKHIAYAIRLSKATVKTIRQNLFWAFIYNLISIPLAAGILFPFFGILINPMIAGAAMAMSSVSVVTNSLRLKRVNITV